MHLESAGGARGKQIGEHAREHHLVAEALLRPDVKRLAAERLAAPRWAFELLRPAPVPAHVPPHPLVAPAVRKIAQREQRERQVVVRVRVVRVPLKHLAKARDSLRVAVERAELGADRIEELRVGGRLGHQGLEQVEGGLRVVAFAGQQAVVKARGE
jgi:hypothetical protein